MPVNEYSKSEYLRALLNSKNGLVRQGGNMLNPAMSNGIGGLAALDTSFAGVQAQPEPEIKEEKKSSGNWFDGFMQNVLGFVDEIVAKFQSGLFGAFEGVVDLGATALGALGDATGWYDSSTFTDWAKQDISGAVSEWHKTAFGLGQWYNRIAHNKWSGEEWGDIGKGFTDIAQASVFAKNDLGNMREQLSNKHYRANDEALEDMGQFGEFLGGIAHSIGFMLPSIATGSIAGGLTGAAEGTAAFNTAAKVGSLASLGLSAAGQGSQEALNEGASAGKALAYGAASGAVEVVSEIVVGKILKGIGLGTDKALGVFGGSLTEKLSKTAEKQLVKEIAKTAFEEGAEEVFSAILEPVTKSIYQGTNAFKDSNGKFIYSSMEYWLGVGGDFNQSVLGQFASGAVTGGLTGGFSETRLYKSLGSEGYMTTKAYANMVEAASKAVDAQEEGGTKFEKAVGEFRKWQKEFAERSYKLKNTDQAKLNKVAQLLSDPAELEEALQKDIDEKTDNNVRKLVNDIVEESGSEKGAEKVATRSSFAELQRVAGTEVKLKFTTKDSHYDGNTNTVYLNEQNLSTEGGKHLVHEYLGHAMANMLSPKAQAKIFEQISANESNKRMIKEVESDKAYKKYPKEEIIARYLSNTFEQENKGKGLGTQLKNLNNLVGNKTLIDHILDMFKGFKGFKTNDPIFKEYAKAINNFLKANSRNAKAKRINAIAEKIKDNEKLTSEEKKFYDKYKEVIDAVANSKEALTENKYAKDLIVGQYTTGDNNKRLEVRKVANGYEVVYDGKTFTEAVIGGNTVERLTNVTRYRVESDLEDVESKSFDTLKEAKEYAEEKGLSNDKIVKKHKTIANYSKEGGKLIKFNTTKNVQAYLDDIKAKKVEYEKKPQQKTTPQRTIIIEGENIESDLKKADSTPLNRVIKVGNKKSVFVKTGNQFYQFKYSSIEGNKNRFRVQTIDLSTGDVIKDEVQSKVKIRSDLSHWTNISNNRADLEVTKKVENTEKPAKTKEKSKKQTENTSVNKEKGKKSETVQKNNTVSENKKPKTEEVSKRTAQDIKNEAEIYNLRTYTKAEVEKTVKNISEDIKKIYENVFEDKDTKIKYNQASFDKISQRIFELINKKNPDPLQIASSIKDIFNDVRIKSGDSDSSVSVDYNLMGNVGVENIVENNIAELMQGGKESKVAALKRIFREVRDTLKGKVRSMKKAGERLAVLLRQRDSLRDRVNKSAKITQSEVVKSGFGVLLYPFTKLHRAGIKFDASEFVVSLDETLKQYNKEKWETDFPELPFSDEISENLIKIRELADSGKITGAEAMTLCTETIRMIEKVMKNVETDYVTKTIPASLQTIRTINNSKRGQSANVLARFWRKYERGFAPAYVVLEEILGGNSAASKMLVYNMQNAANKRVLYKGAYADRINTELKNRGLKKTFDTKKLTFRGHNLTIDQAMGLYISTQVQANFDAINEDGVSYYDQASDRIVEIANKGEAAALKAEIEKTLPDSYQKFADWLLGAMNGSVKSEYMGWYEQKYGKYQGRNEIGKIGDKSYWSLKRSYQKISNVTKAISNPDAVFSHAISRTNGGNNQVLITGALGTFDAYIDKLSREIFTKPVYEQTLSILNAKTNGNESVMDVLSKRDGSGKDIKYLKDTMANMLDVNKRQANLLDKMVSAFSVAKLALNIGSMAKQFASAFTSNIPISKTMKAIMQRWSPEAKGELKVLVDGVKYTQEEISKAKKGDEAYGKTTDDYKIEPVGGIKYREATKGVITANADSLTKATEKIAKVGMWGISKVDLFTINTGVFALMVIGQDQFNAKIGTEANIEFVKEHWAEYELSQIGNGALSKNMVSNSNDTIVRHLFSFLQGANRAALGSQIHKWNLWQRNKNVDEKLLKSELERAKARLDKAENAYNADPDNEAVRNEYIEAKTDVIDLQNKVDDYNSFKIAGGKAILPNMAAGILAQGVLVALVNALMKRIKGKKEWGELDIVEEGLAFIRSLSVDWVPLVNQISSIMQGYEVSVPAINILNQFSAIFKNYNNGNYKTMIKQIAILVGDMTGIPFETLYAYIYGTLKGFDPAIAYEMRSVLYGTSVQSATKTMQTYAAKGSESKTASLVGLIMTKYKTGSSTEQINREIANLYIEGYNAIPKTTMTQYTDDNGDVVKLTNDEIQQFMQVYSQSTKDVSKLMALTDYRSATSEEKAKAIKKIYDAYYAIAKAKITGGQVEGKLAKILSLTNGNIGLAKYILSLQKIAQISETAKKTRKELVMQYINRLRGYTKAEKTLLMYLAGYSVSGTSETMLKSLLIRSGASAKSVKEL